MSQWHLEGATFRIERPDPEDSSKQLRIYCAADWKHFQELIQRGSNLWPDAPPEIKELADLVTNGKVMQDYYRQAGIATLPEGNWQCSCGVILKGGTTHMNCPNVQTNQEQPK